MAECNAATAAVDARAVLRIIAEADAKQLPPTRGGHEKTEFWICVPSFRRPRPRVAGHVRLVDGREVLEALRTEA